MSGVVANARKNVRGRSPWRLEPGRQRGYGGARGLANLRKMEGRRRLKSYFSLPVKQFWVDDQIGKRIFSQSVKKRFQRVSQNLFQFTFSRDFTGVSFGIETFHQREIGFERSDQAAKIDLAGFFQKPNAAALSFDTLDITQPRKFMHDLHDMIFGDAIALGNLPRGTQSILMRRQIHERSEGIVCK